MLETNKTYRIKTDIGKTDGFINIDTSLLQDYESLDILSVKIKSVDTYKLHNSNYGVVVGRVLANNGFGVPNAKISIFIESDGKDGEKVRDLYPFTSVSSIDKNGVRYNLLPDNKVNDCHQIVGTFPNKRYMLDNDLVLEVFDKYYKYTTRTNNSGDYLIMGVPVGTHTLHMDLDLSDCGILSQKPRDFVHKGYTIEQFESPTIFKKDTELSNLSQIFSQNQTINIQPFWGNESNGEQIGLTRADINVSFKFETTCVFMGSVVSDSPSNGITRKCMATENMGNMEELTTGEGTIEMIRKTPSGEIEEFQVRGTQLIDANGVWCYQIPMNLDYMMTDEYGNMVPTDDPEKGVPTRASVRFRISMQDNDESTDNFYRAKVLVPHNPQFKEDGEHEQYDYEFGTLTKDESFRDLFMDNVYSVKTYIPRFQKKKTRGWKDKNFTGIKSCNFHGNNNPIPYNNIRIKLPLMFTVMCAFIKCFIFLTGIFNTIISMLGNFLSKLGSYKIFGKRIFPAAYNTARELKLNVLSEGLCPDLENWYFAPMKKVNLKKRSGYDLMKQTLNHLLEEDGYGDEKSIEHNNSEYEDELLCITTKTDYLISCIEMNLAMEYKVINFDFYNDWINGMIYIPRFMYYFRKKKTFLGITLSKAKIRSCMDNTRIFGKTRRYTQQCAIPYKKSLKGTYITYSEADNILDRSKSKRNIKKSNNFHKKNGFTQVTIFGRKGGICHEHTTSKKQNVYYMKPCEWKDNTKVLFYATDIILLGSLQSCNKEGIPQAFKYLSSTSYTMPTNLALTNMETNGALYMNDKNTVCAGNSSQLNFGQENENDAIRVFDPKEGLAGELKAYSGAGDRNIDTQYEGNELSDLIPLTEAAGIAWNYTGPDQGEINEKQMYYPGGHFLGMTCTNSQTNIKSCINLSRICELGVNMSQRKEDISEITFDKETGQSIIKYVNNIPTGFISGNDIVAEDFRSMFATLNQNRLKATKLNAETGYYIYDFDFIKPVNFDGSFKKPSSTNDYNNKISYIDSEYIEKQAEELKKYGIANQVNRPDDEGSELTIETQSLTNEDISLDYYRFRLGLDYSNLNVKNRLQKTRFLINNGSKFYLPQYENSFYFYFGMKQGATAIDEFNRQFFSICDTSKIVTGIPTIDVSVSNIEVCNGTGAIKVTFDNFELPLRSFYYERDIDGGIETVYLMGKNDKYKTQYTSIIDNDGKGLPFGRYTFYATDSNGVEISKTIELGIDLFLYELNTYDFNVFDSSEWLNTKGNREEKDKNIYVGGYANISNLDVLSEYKDLFDNRPCNIIIKDENGKVFTGNTSFGNENSVDIYIDKANNIVNGEVVPALYHVYIQYSGITCISSASSDTVMMYVTSFSVKDGKNVKLKMGSPEHNLYYTIGSRKNDDDCELTYPILYGVDEEGNIIDIGPNSTKLYPKYILSSTTESVSGNTLYFGNGGGITSANLNSNTIGEWIKSVSTIKSTDKTFTHSNNVFTEDLKILWGNPQNSEGRSDGIYSSEEIIPNGFSLDDDASYVGTDIPYSSIAVDGNCVSGDFFAILSDGDNIITDLNYTNKGQLPKINTGYVFKPLPEGDLEYYIYNGIDNLKHSGEYTDGVFYSSFYYPVIEKPFKASGNFFIWNDRFVYVPENKDGEPEIKYEELAGRCEIYVENGIRYNGKFGAEGANLEATNIPSDNLSGEFTSEKVTVTGMTFSGYFTKDNGDEIYEQKDSSCAASIYGDKSARVASGYTGQTEIYFNFSEGYPDLEKNITNKDYIKEYYLSSLVNTYSEYFEYDGNFSDYASYEFLPGEGVVAYFKNIDENKFRTYKVSDYIISNEINPEDTKKHFCLLCYQENNLSYDRKLIVNEDGNEKYHYLKFGKKKPTYYVLFRYIKKWNDNETPYHDNRIGDLCFVKIDYYRKSRFRLYFSYNVYDTSDEDDGEDGETSDGGQVINITQKFKKAYSDRGNLYKLIEDKILKVHEDKGGIRKYMEPVIKMKILDKYNGNSRNWLELIYQHHERYIRLPKDKLSTGGTYYCVEQRKSNNLTLYKIYPTFLEELKDDEGIILNRYSVENNLLKDGDNYVLENNDVTYVTISYEMISGSSTNGYEYAQNINSAINSLKFKTSNNSTSGTVISISGKSIVSNYYTIEVDGTFDSVTNEKDYYSSDDSKSIYYSDGVTFFIKFSMKVSFIDKNNYINQNYNDSIKFYLGNEFNGETLRITLYKYSSILLFIENGEFLQEKVIDFENTGGSKEIKLGVNINDLERYNIKENQYKGIFLYDAENNYKDNIACYRQISRRETYNGIDYFTQTFRIDVTQGSRNDYENILAFRIEFNGYEAPSKLEPRFKNYLKINVKEGEEGIWFEPKNYYYYVQDGEYNETLNEWKSNNPNTVSYLGISDSLVGSLNGLSYVESSSDFSIPYINSTGMPIPISTQINNGDKLTFELKGGTDKTWYDENIYTMVSKAKKDFNAFKDIEYILTTSDGSKEYKCDVIFKVRPYSCFKLINKINDNNHNNDVKLLIYHTDNTYEEFAVNNSYDYSINFIPKYCDFNGDNINLKLKFNKRPNIGLHYLKTNNKPYSNSDNIIVLGENYGELYDENESRKWDSSITYDIELKKSSYKVGNNGNVPELYLKTFEKGDFISYKIVFNPEELYSIIDGKLDDYNNQVNIKVSFKFLYESTTIWEINNSSDIEKTINLSELKVGNYNFELSCTIDELSNEVSFKNTKYIEFHGNKEQSDLLYKEEIEDYNSNSKNFSYTVHNINLGDFVQSTNESDTIYIKFSGW